MMQSQSIIVLFTVWLTWCVQLRSAQQERTLLSYHTCQSDADCDANSTCHGYTGSGGGSITGNSGLCKCLDGYLMIRSRMAYTCVLPADSIRSKCTRDEECERTLGIDSHCDERNECNCIEGAHFVKHQNACYKTSRLNETCLANENCVPNHPDDDVYCTNGRCTCGLKRAPNSEGRCVVVRRLGEQCNNDDYCRAMNAVCRVVCTCRAGFVLRDDQRTCLPVANKLLDACIQESQCNAFIRDSECIRGRCQCKTGYHEYADNCYPHVGLRSLCQNKGECVTSLDLDGRVDCIDSVCTCRSDLDPETCADPSSAIRWSRQSLDLIAFVISIFLFILI